MPNVNKEVNDYIINRRGESIHESIAYTVTNTPYPFDSDGKRFMISKLNDVLDFTNSVILESLRLLGYTVKNIYFYQVRGVQSALYRFVIDLSWNLMNPKFIVVDALFVSVPYKECRSCHVTFSHSTCYYDIDEFCKLSVGAFNEYCEYYSKDSFQAGFARLRQADIDDISQKAKEFEELELVSDELIELRKWCDELKAFADKTKIPVVFTAGMNPYKQNINQEEKENMLNKFMYNPVTKLKFSDEFGLAFSSLDVARIRDELEKMSDMTGAGRTPKKLNTVTLNDIVQIRVTGNGRGTTVYWSDGTNTTVLKPDGVEYDGRTAIVFAMTKRNYNNESNAYTRAMDKIFNEKAVFVPTKKERKSVKKSKLGATNTETTTTDE